MPKRPRTFACDGYHACRPSRRSLLKVGGAGLLGLTMPGLLRAGEAMNTARAAGAPALPPIRPRARSVVFLYQFGGPSHIDMFDMKPDAPDAVRGPHKPIKSAVPEMPVS